MKWRWCVLRGVKSVKRGGSVMRGGVEMVCIEGWSGDGVY